VHGLAVHIQNADLQKFIDRYQNIPEWNSSPPFDGSCIVKKQKGIAGYFRNGLPYNRFGNGARTLIIFQGLLFENKPLDGLMLPLFSDMYTFLDEDFTTYIVTRKPGLPDGYSMQNMSDDYATMIKEEFGEPVDVIGVSTGGSIAQYFAADHPDLLRKLIIHSSAYTLSDSARKGGMRIGELARQRKWRQAYAAFFSPTLHQRGETKRFAGVLTWLTSLMGRRLLGKPKDPSDLVITIEAEDKLNFKERLAQIKAPTLVIAGEEDPFYTEALFRKTAEGIPNARLILYKGMGHPAGGKQFQQDVMAFLKDGGKAAI
jgi:pimeloyl-ACP methyl ester carboxylesterase